MDSSKKRSPSNDLQPGGSGGSDQVRQKLSRREWLVEVGETAAALGIGGPALERIDALGEGHRAASNEPLPLGLYEPSLDMLTHALESGSRFRPAPAGTQTDYIQPPRGPYAPRFFSDDEFETVRKLVRVVLDAGSPANEALQAEPRERVSEEISEWIDLVLFREPEVREAAHKVSSQHRELAVHIYGAQEVWRLETEDQQRDWREGFDWLSAESNRRYGKPPSGLGNGELAAIVENAVGAGTDAGPVDAGAHFAKLLKARVIEGYYTSQAGLAELGSTGHSFHAESPGCPKQKHRV